MVLPLSQVISGWVPPLFCDVLSAKTKDKKTLEKLSDPKELEKFAREQYYLKKKNLYYTMKFLFHIQNFHGI